MKQKINKNLLKRIIKCREFRHIKNLKELPVRNLLFESWLLDFIAEKHGVSCVICETVETRSPTINIDWVYVKSRRSALLKLFMGDLLSTFGNKFSLIPVPFCRVCNFRFTQFLTNNTYRYDVEEYEICEVDFLATRYRSLVNDKFKMTKKIIKF